MPTRDSLLDVTARLYAEYGWRGTTTRRIAEAAGVNEVTVFRQFGSKESLLLEAIQHASQQVPATLPGVPSDLRSELVRWATAHHRSIAQKRGIILSCLAEAEERPALAPQACEGGRVAREELTAYLRRAADRGLITLPRLIDAGAALLMRSVFMDAMTRDVIPEVHAIDFPTLIDCQVELLLRGLGAGEDA
ncbi:MAG TPA: helix-turn-helix domain-containing protein [Gemmatimonadales bacterium]|jgi:AcrR family transcriptional regulator